MSSQSQDHGAYVGLEQIIKGAKELYGNGAHIVAPSCCGLPRLITDVTHRCEEEDIPEVVRNFLTLPGLWIDKDGYTLATLMSNQRVLKWSSHLSHYLFHMDYDDFPNYGLYNHALYIQNWSKHGYTALHFAAQNGDVDFLRIEEDVEDVPNFEGETALYLAIEHDRKDFIDELLLCNSGLVVWSAIFTNRKGKSALVLAKDKGLIGLVEAIKGRAKSLESGLGYWPTARMVECMLDCGLTTQTTIREEDLYKKVLCAVENSDLELFQSCMDQYPAKMLAWRDDTYCNTLLHWLLLFWINAARHSMAMTILDIASQSENDRDFINRTNKHGDTAEHIVIKRGQLGYLDLLHSRGSDIYARDNQGYNALYCFLSSETVQRYGEITKVLNSILCLDQYYLRNPSKIAGSRKEPERGELIKTKGDNKCALELILKLEGLQEVNNRIQTWPELVTMLSKEDESKVNGLWEQKRRNYESKVVIPTQNWLEIVAKALYASHAVDKPGRCVEPIANPQMTWWRGKANGPYDPDSPMKSPPVSDGMDRSWGGKVQEARDIISQKADEAAQEQARKDDKKLQQQLTKQAKEAEKLKRAQIQQEKREQREQEGAEKQRLKDEQELVKLANLQLQNDIILTLKASKRPIKQVSKQAKPKAQLEAYSGDNRVVVTTTRRGREIRPHARFRN